MRRLSWVVVGVFCAAVMLSGGQARAGTCGNGIVEGGEECDGTILFIYGDPDNPTCKTGGNCFFQNTCCKFNCQFVGQGPPCDDGDVCSSFDTCDQYGQCQGGPSELDGSPCDDGLFCTGTESCLNGRCTSSSGDPCPGTACNNCQEATDSCFDPAGSSCSDGSVCVTGGSCDGSGTCAGGVLNSGPCDDGLYCNGADTCNGGSCSVHEGNPCTGADGDGNCTESCNEAADNCSAPDPDGAACNDGQFCNGAADQCAAGTCSGTGSAACDDGNDCTIDSCNESLDTCTMSGTLVDGTPCSDGEACTLDDVCTGGLCVGDTSALEDLCPWALTLREHPTRDIIKTRSKVSVTGDVCGGTMRLSGQPFFGSDLVSDEAEGTPLLLPLYMTVADDIVSSGGGAIAIRNSFLPYVTPDTAMLPGGGITPKNDASGEFDFSGAHPLATACHAARTSYADVTANLDLLPVTDTAGPVKLKPGQTAVITAANPGGVNVIDLDGSVKVGIGSVLQLDGGGDAATVMVLRISGGFSLYTLAQLELTGELLPQNTLIHVKGKKCRLSRFSYGSGTLFCSPGRVLAQGTAWVGTIYADGRSMAFRDKSSISYMPFQGF
jgi:hypothetical protein